MEAKEKPIVIIACEGYEEENTVLRAVGCQVKLCGELREITFPAGTTQQPYKNVTVYAHLCLTLPEPDGREVYAYERLQRDSIYVLRYPISFLPTDLPALREVREKHAVSLLDLSQKSGLGIRVMQRMDAEGEGKIEHIDRLLLALSQLSGQRYSRWNVGGFTYI